MQNIIYYNKHSGCFVEFEIEATLPLDCFNGNMNAKDAASAAIDSLMPYILSFGDTLAFPKDLLDELANKNEDEIDLFLLASYDKSIRDSLESYLYVRVQGLKHHSYFDRKTYEYHHAEAIGKNGMLLCKSKENNGFLLGSFSFFEIENSFIFM